MVLLSVIDPDLSSLSVIPVSASSPELDALLQVLPAPQSAFAEHGIKHVPAWPHSSPFAHCESAVHAVPSLLLHEPGVILVIVPDSTTSTTICPSFSGSGASNALHVLVTKIAGLSPIFAQFAVD